MNYKSKEISDAKKEVYDYLSRNGITSDFAVADAIMELLLHKGWVVDNQIGLGAIWTGVSARSIRVTCTPPMLSWEKEQEVLAQNPHFVDVRKSILEKGQISPITIEIPSLKVVDGVQRVLSVPPEYPLTVRLVHLA